MQPTGRYAAAANAFIPVEFAEWEAAESVAQPSNGGYVRKWNPGFQPRGRCQCFFLEIQSTSARDEVRMAEEVEAELRAMEQAEFERLAADQKDFGLEGVPDDGQNGQVNTLSGWDQRYEGRHRVVRCGEPQAHVAIPGYQCLEAGKVVVEVDIARDDVTKARVVQSAAVRRSLLKRRH